MRRTIRMRYLADFCLALALALPALPATNQLIRPLPFSMQSNGPIIPNLFKSFPIIRCAAPPATKRSPVPSAPMRNSLVASNLGIAMQSCSSSNCGTSQCSQITTTSCQTNLALPITDSAIAIATSCTACTFHNARAVPDVASPLVCA
jgi:hypothetical protein